MKPEKYNPKAREAFGKSLIDIGGAIFKSIMLLITVAPITFIVKGAMDGQNTDPFDFFVHFSAIGYIGFVLFIITGIFVGCYFRNEGLRHIHELEENN